MRDYADELSIFLSAYKNKRKPIDVDFRSIVPLPNHDRLTHFIHPYPAKLLQNIPIFFLNNSLLTKKNDLVFDPFCGSGTVALEAIASQKKCIATDLNPFACLLSRVKCTHVESGLINCYLTQAIEVSREKKPLLFNIVNRELWFKKERYDNLSKLMQAINEIEDSAVKDFFRICFSVTMRKVSNADPRVSVPVRINAAKYPDGHRLKSYYEGIQKTVDTVDLYELFSLVVAQNMKRITQIETLNTKTVHIFTRDARKQPWKRYTEKVDLIITSPPYPGAQKYIRACSLSIGWLELFEGELIDLKRQIIGREEVSSNDCIGNSGHKKADKAIEKIYRINKVRATIAESYLRDMQQVLQSCHSYLKKDGWLVLVAANNLFCMTEFLTLEYLKDIAIQEGFQCHLEMVDTIKSHGLMTKRNKSAGLISREGILLLKKCE